MAPSGPASYQSGEAFSKLVSMYSRPCLQDLRRTDGQRVGPGGLLFPDMLCEEPGRLVADDVVSGRIGVMVAKPAGEVPEMGVEPVVHDDDLPAADERRDPGAVPLRDLLQRVAAVVEHLRPVRQLGLVA